MSDTLPLHIYDEMLDKAGRAGTATPDGHHGDDPAMAWLPELLAGTAEALVPDPGPTPGHGRGDDLVYSRFIADSAPQDAFSETVAHVRAHLSSVATVGDDPDARAPEVRIEYVGQTGGQLVVGRLTGHATAPYLEDGYDPDTEPVEFDWVHAGDRPE